MTDAEISRRLALAIGWKEKDFIDSDPVIIECEEGWWNEFDYRDPAVIWPIAERFDCFPLQSEKEWAAVFRQDRHQVVWQAVFATTAAKAVALAVIKAHEGAKE